jgi:putative ABC transport system permease protein
MRLIIRNLLHVLRRFKLAAILNVLGLSVAFTALMVIMMQLYHDYSFDKFHKDYDKIFRLEMTSSTQPGAIAVFARPFAENFFESSPHIVAGAIKDLFISAGDVYFQVENESEQHYFKEQFIKVSPSWTDVFTFDLVEGNKDALKTPDNVIIPLSLARRMFGNESAIGKQLVSDEKRRTVGAVYRDFPANSVINNSIYYPMTDDEFKQEWGNQLFQVYIRVNDESNVSMLTDNFMRNFDFATVFGEYYTQIEELGLGLRLTALPDIRYATDVQFDATPKADRRSLMILFIIGIMLITIAAINFTNFSMALTPMRIRNINTQRVMGAQQSTIRWILVIEAVVFTLISYLAAIVLVNRFASSMLANLVDVDLSFSANSLVIIGTALVAVLVGVIAGFYPSRYMTSFAPAIALKGSFGMSPKGKMLRNILIGVQFIASFALIIGASFMYLQNRFMHNSSLGYNHDVLVTVDIRQIQTSRDAFIHQILSHSSISDITFSETALASADSYNKWGFTHKGEMLNFQVFVVDYTFLEVMGIAVSEGRDFHQEDVSTSHGVWIFNETARKQYNLELNVTFEDWVRGEIVGFAPDIKVASFRMAIEPMAFYVRGTENNWEQLNHAYIKLNTGANLRTAIDHIRATLAEFDSNYPFEIRFFDDVLQQLYEKERTLSFLILLFSLIAIFISIVGVFGLVVFDSECRRKEIGIRKVLGSSVAEIITMFNKAYIKILLICFVIAAPIAWFAVSRWLENFAYRTPMYWWVYLLAFIAVTAVTVLTVTIQNWRVANDDPVKSIKTE